MMQTNDTDSSMDTLPSRGNQIQNWKVHGLGGTGPTSVGPFAAMFPCDEPVNPQYRDYNKRLKTFENFPKKEILNPQRAAAAGLYYLGDRDRCKCFYCNGGLQHWMHGDDAMTEHAKYFPQCEFVLQQKGIDYVSDLNAKFPNLKRPTANQNNQSSNTHQNYQTRGQDIPPQYNEVQDSMDIPPQDFPETSKQPLICETELIEEAKRFGFDERSIKMVMTIKRDQGNFYDGLTELVSDLIQFDQKHGSDTQEMEVPMPQNHTNDLMQTSCGQDAIQSQWREPAAIKVGCPRDVMADSAHLATQLKRQCDETKCKNCFMRDRSCVFLPCGHLSLCYECGQHAKRCGVCNVKVSQAIKVFKP